MKYKLGIDYVYNIQEKVAMKDQILGFDIDFNSIW